MAYGYARGRSPEPDPRDVVEEAARAAGLTVEQWLERAAEDDRDGRSRRFRPGRRRAARDLDDRRPARDIEDRRPARGDGLSEDRVSRILDDALDAMQDTIRANEERTAGAIEALERKLGGDAPRGGGRVRAMRDDIERRFDRRPANDEPERESALPRHIEERLSNVVGLIEQRARDDDRGPPPPRPTDLRQPGRGVERQIAALNARIEALAGELSERAQRQESRLESRRDEARENVDVGGALDRLQQELARMQAPRPQSDPMLEALRTLDGKVSQLARPTADARIDRLANEFAALRAGLGRQPQPDARLSAMERQFESLGGRLDAIAEKLATLRLNGPRDLRAHKSADAAFDELKRMIQESAAPAHDGAVLEAMQALERRLEALQHPPKTLTDTLDRVQSIDRKLDSLQRTPPEIAARLGQLDKIDALERKLDAMQRAPEHIARQLDDIRMLVSERPKGETRLPGMEAALAAVVSRLDQMHPPGPQAIDRLQSEIQLLGRKFESAGRGEPDAQDSEALERIRSIEDKLDALNAAPAELAQRLDHIQDMMRGIPATLQAAPVDVAVRLDQLQDLMLSRPAGGSDGSPDLAARLDQIERLIEERAAPPAQGLDLAQRLDELQEMVQARPAANGMSPGVETLLRNLSLRLESMQSGPADELSLDRLHDDIRQISRRLEANPGAHQMPGLAELGSIERSVSELFGQIDTLRAGIGEAAEQAARKAADDVMRRAAPAGAAAPDEAVLRQLDDIHAAQQDADRRANATLGAVHETLKRVVDRLVDLEQDIKARPAPPAASATAQSAPAAAVPPPLTTAPLPALGAAEPEALRAQPPALRGEAAPGSAASLRALRLGVAAPALADPASSKAGVGAMFAAARGAVSGLKLGKGKAKMPEPAAEEPAPAAPPALPAGSGLDLPLEPGSGRPRPGAPAAEPLDPKANFLAAARRAAQAAAEQSGEALAEAREPAKAGKALPKLAQTRKNLSKKQVILLGLAALVVAVGATLQIMNSPPPKLAPQPERVSNLDRLFGRTAPPQQTAQALPAPTAPAARETADPGAAPRQILPQTAEARAPQRDAAPKSEERVATLPPRAPAPGAFMPPDPTTVGSIAAEPPKPAEAAPARSAPAAAATAADPLLRFEGVTGAERLKAAARAGDASAFIELGNRHLEGRGAPRDFRIAAQWFERAADLGSAPAQFRLGAMHREGRGVERNAKTAIRHFQAAAEAGNARAMYNAAVLLAEGVNGSPDYAAAGEWFKKAAEFGIRDAQYNLAILYARGLGVGQDLLASYAWFAAAAASGDEDATKKRDEVATRLDPAKLAQAKAAAAAWKPKTPDPAANEVPTPPGGWDSAAKQVPSAAVQRPERRL